MQAIAILIALFAASNLQAQVTIGSGENPNAGALLDLKMDNQGMSTKGLVLPRVTLNMLNPGTPAGLAASIGGSGAWDMDGHIGLAVYNSASRETDPSIETCPGIHIWDGSEWQAIIPYPPTSETRVLQSVTPKGLTHLNPANASDPMWAFLGKSPGNYPLGYIGAFTDSRPGDTPQTYHYTRFYVGYTSVDSLFQITRNRSCDQNPAKAVVATETTTGEFTFEDGVWMGENLRATRMPDGTALTLTSYTSANSLDFYYSYPDNQAANKNLGVFYNYYTASGGGITGIEDYSRFQGICPNGWFLPTDHHWTDLENGIIINTSKFSSTPDIGIANIVPYGASSSPAGIAMKASSVINGVASNGTSKPALQGGFNAYLSTGTANSSTIPPPPKFGETTYFYSAVNGNRLGAKMRGLSYNSTSMSHVNSRWQVPVRCMKN
ncbi:hypothetical protein D0T66_02845 [Dysgonomonas sp. 25]|nr:hypothetical protein [Dysgonomonas sp. 25]